MNTGIKKNPQKTHLTWSIEDADLQCPSCGGKTVLLSPINCWTIDSEDLAPDEDDDAIEIHDEITVHYCRACELTTSLSLNTRR